jgi:hypothetical protein
MQKELRVVVVSKWIWARPAMDDDGVGLCARRRKAKSAE